MASKLLILEDDAHLGPLLKSSLEKAGYHVSLHTDATSALEQFDTGTFDCVIADLFVIKDGVHSEDGGILLISAIKQVRSDPVPVIAISGAFSSENGFYVQNTARTVGADKLLGKPFSPRELMTTIEALCAEQRQEPPKKPGP